VVKATGEKLSKANRDTGIRDLRKSGWSAHEVLGAAAHACGLLEAPMPLDAATLPSLFACAGPG
jgi:hypothetical protein